MMLGEVSTVMYRYIIEAEFVFLQKFKLNPFEIMKSITVTDLVSYMNQLEHRIKKEGESILKKDLEKALVALRDILIFITMGKDGLRMKL